MKHKISGLWWDARMGYTDPVIDDEIVEKFAELVVEQCLEHLRAVDHHSNPCRELIPVLIKDIEDDFEIKN